MDEKTEKLKKLALYLVIAACSVFLAAVLCYLIPKVAVLLMPFLIGFLISLIMHPLVKVMHKYLHFPNQLAAIVSLVLTVALIGTGLYYLIVTIIRQCVDLYYRLPELYNTFLEQYAPLIERISGFYEDLPADTKSMIDSFLQNIPNQLANFIQPVTRFAAGVTTSLPSVLIFTVVMMMSAYFMSADKRMMPNILRKITSEAVYERIRQTKAQMFRALGAYFKAQLIILSVVFLILSLCLNIAGVDYAFLFALCIAIFDALPIFGSGAVLIPWSLIALIGGEIRLAVTLIITYGIIILTRQLIEPKLVSVQIGVHPLATLLAMYVGLRLFGIIGLILGPVIVLVASNFYRTYQAEKSGVPPPENKLKKNEG